MHADRLTVAQVARRSGFAPSALRFYEEQGLIEAERTTGNQRRYQRQVLRRLAFVRAASVVGLSLDEIRAELTSLPSDRSPSKADWTRISRHWRGRIDEQIAALERLRDGLDSCIGCGCLSMRSCTLSNPQDVYGRRGARAAVLLPRALRN